MKYAIKNHKKIEATKSGEIAKCPACNSDVRAYCGEYNVNHWKHISKRDCDFFWKEETEWHRNWKNNFPKEWQETVLFDEDSGEKHIADIKTDKGIVVEFQNSEISSYELIQREQFYEKLIWVVNASEFENNLELKSIVNYHLRGLERDYHSRINDTNKHFEEVTKEKKTLVNNKKNDIESLGIKLDCLIKEICEYQKLLFSIDKLPFDLENIIIELNEHNISREFSDFKRRIKKDAASFLDDTKQKIKNLSEKLKKTDKEINDIKNLEDDHDPTYKLIPYKLIPDITEYSKISFLKKQSLDTNLLFPEQKEKITYESQLASMLRKKEDYVFYFDYQDSVEKLENKKTDMKEEITVLNNNKQTESEITISKVYDFISKKIEETKDEAEKTKKTIYNAQKELYKEINNLNSFIDNERKKRTELLKRLKENEEEERCKIMREYKGLYKVIWKHRRKVWLDAYCKVYFDLGGNFLFYIKESSYMNVKTLLLVKKISKHEFIGSLY